MSSRPSIGELFAGYGGLGMGVQAALDGEIAWYSEIDKGAVKILEHRFPNVPNIGDITAVDWSTVEPVDILTGGFPCQDVSNAGNRAGLRPETRSGLWAQFAYAISQLQPSLVVIENVQGLLTADAHCDLEPCTWCLGEDPDRPLRALGAVLGGLAELGLDAEWVSLYASDVGAPHGRPRVFVIAWPAANTQRRGLNRWSCQPRREPQRGTPSDRNPAGALLPTPGAYDAERGGPQHPHKRREGGHSVSLQDALHGLTLLPTPAVNDMGEGKSIENWDEWTVKMKAKHQNGNGHGKSLAIELQRVESGWGPYAPAIARWESILNQSAPNPSESARVREFMMGLPSGWVTDVPGITRTETLKALGNGVVIQQAEAAVRFLLRRLAVAA